MAFVIIIQVEVSGIMYWYSCVDTVYSTKLFKK